MIFFKYMNKCEINYFISRTGENPIRDFLDKHPKVKVKTFYIFLNIEKYGLISAIPHIKKLKNTPLWEIKIVGKESTRILYFSESQNSILLLHAFIKKTQKTPIKEITIALKRLNQVKC